MCWNCFSPASIWRGRWRWAVPVNHGASCLLSQIYVQRSCCYLQGGKSTHSTPLTLTDSGPNWPLKPAPFHREQRGWHTMLRPVSVQWPLDCHWMHLVFLVAMNRQRALNELGNRLTWILFNLKLCPVEAFCEPRKASPFSTSSFRWRSLRHFHCCIWKNLQTLGRFFFFFCTVRKSGLFWGCYAFTISSEGARRLSLFVVRTVLRWIIRFTSDYLSAHSKQQAAVFSENPLQPDGREW